MARRWRSWVRRGSPALILVMAVSALLASPSPAIAARPGCDTTSTGLVPLNDLGTGSYLGEEGGLYPDGSNTLPRDHLGLVRRSSRLVRPLGENGAIDASGRIGLIAIGGTDTTLEFEKFTTVAVEAGVVNPRLVLVNGAQDGRFLERWSQGPEADPWFGLAVDVSRAGLTSEQVQAAWIKLSDRNLGTDSLQDAGATMGQLMEVVRIAKDLYPNLTVAYLSSRIYGGYGGDAKAEPGAYQDGFAVKWLIQRQIDGDPALNADPGSGSVVAPWLAWGPYLWADGEVPRSDGLVWRCEDFAEDGVNPGPTGSDKVAQLLLGHFSTHPTSSNWFLADKSANRSPREPETPRSGEITPDQRRTDLSAEQSEPSESSEGMSSSRLGWFAAGAAAGLGVSLTVVFVLLSRRLGSGDRPA